MLLFRMLPSAPVHSSDGRAGIQALKALPDHLLSITLVQIPIQQCLRHLPPTFHAQALRAHHPSVDSHNALSLPRLNPSLLPFAIAAAATLQHLQTLSLTEHTLPPEAAACLSPLSTLTALTALTLRDVALSNAHACALASTLPFLYALQTLDLSRNRLTAAVMHSLSPALAQSTALRSLGLQKAFSRSSPAEPTNSCTSTPLQSLATALPNLVHLTSLTLGTRELAPHAADTHADVETLLHSLNAISTLRHLELDFPVGACSPESKLWATPLATITSLHSLHLCVPDEAGDSTTRLRKGGAASAQASGHAVGDALRCLTDLTALQLDLTHCDLEGPRVVHLLSGLTALTLLRRLWLRAFFPLSHAGTVAAGCTALADALPALAALSSLYLRAAHRSRGHVTAFGRERSAPGVSSVTHVAAAAVAGLPHLQRMHVPVSTAPDGHEQLVSTLAAATRLLLSVDLYVWLTVPFVDDADEDPQPIVINCAVRHYTRLFPFVRLVDVFYYDRSMPEEFVMQPLAAAASRLQQLRSLTITARPVRNDGPVRDFLDSAAVHCTKLSSLDVDLAVWPTLACDPHYGYLKLTHFFSHLQALTTLTRLCWSVGDVCTTPMPEPQLVPVCSGLANLQVFHVRPYVAAQRDEYAALFDRLVLRTAVVVMHERAHATDVEALLEHLPHLRSVRLQGAQRLSQGRLKAAVQRLPDCAFD